MKNYPAFYLLAVSVCGISGYLHAEEQPCPASRVIFLSEEVCSPFGQTVDDPRMKLAAVTDGNFEPLKQYLREGGKVNGRLSNGMSLLEVAVQYGGDDVVAYLISQGAEVRKRDAKGRSLGTLAAMQGRTKVLNMLLNAYPEPPNLEEMWIPLVCARMEEYMSHFRSSMHWRESNPWISGPPCWPVVEGDVMGGLRTLLERGIDPDTVCGRDTALGIYAAVGDVQAVKLLLGFRADVNAMPADGTPLMRAIVAGRPEIVWTLYDAGADMRKGAHGQSALLACMVQPGTWDERTLRMLCAESDANSFGEVLKVAKRTGCASMEKEVMDRCREYKSLRKEAFASLVRNFSDRRYLDDRQWCDLALGLIRQGLDAEDMQTGLRESVRLGKPELVRCMLEHGGDARVLDEKGRTLLMLAVLSRDGGAMENAELLIQYGVDAEARDAEGKTAAMMAEARGFSTLSMWIRECEEKYAKTAVRNAPTDNPNKKQ